MMAPLGSKLGQVTSFIKDHKGPPEVDRWLLYPAGQQIMGSLIGGLDSEVPALGSKLADITDLIDIKGAVSLSAAAGGSAIPRAGAGTVKNYYITAPGACAEPITEEGLGLVLRKTELMYDESPF